MQLRIMSYYRILSFWEAYVISNVTPHIRICTFHLFQAVSKSMRMIRSYLGVLTDKKQHEREDLSDCGWRFAGP